MHVGFHGCCGAKFRESPHTPSIPPNPLGETLSLSLSHTHRADLTLTRPANRITNTRRKEFWGKQEVDAVDGHSLKPITTVAVRAFTCASRPSIWAIFSSEPAKPVEGATIGSLVSNRAGALGPGRVKGPVPSEPYYGPDPQSISTTLKRIHNTTAIKTRRGLNQTRARGRVCESGRVCSSLTVEYGAACLLGVTTYV